MNHKDAFEENLPDLLKLAEIDNKLALKYCWLIAHSIGKNHAIDVLEIANNRSGVLNALDQK